MRRLFLTGTLILMLISFLAATDEELVEKFKQVEEMFGVQNFEEALPILDEILQADPDYEDALIYRITWNVLMTDDMKLIFSDMGKVAEMRESPSSIYEELGYICVDNERDARAVELMNHAIPLYPEAYDLYVIRGVAHRHQEKYAEACKDLEKSLSLKPDYEYALLELAGAKFDSGDSQSAFNTTDRILKFNPESHLAYHSRFIFHDSLNQTEEARTEIQKAIELTAGDPANQGYYYGVLAFDYDEDGQSEKAEELALLAKSLGEITPMMLLSTTPDVSRVISVDNYPFIPGGFFAYEVNSFGTYWFAIEVDSNSSEGIIFDWMMSNSVDNQGRIIMDETDINQANMLHNYFHGGETTKLVDKTSVWVSRQVFTDLKKGEDVEIDTGSGFRTFRLTGSEKFQFLANGVNLEINAVRVESIDHPEGAEPEVLIIKDDEQDPVILAMDLGWTITLKQGFINNDDDLNRFIEQNFPR